MPQYHTFRCWRNSSRYLCFVIPKWWRLLFILFSQFALPWVAVTHMCVTCQISMPIIDFCHICLVSSCNRRRFLFSFYCWKRTKAVLQRRIMPRYKCPGWRDCLRVRIIKNEYTNDYWCVLSYAQFRKVRKQWPRKGCRWSTRTIRFLLSSNSVILRKLLDFTANTKNEQSHSKESRELEIEPFTANTVKIQTFESWGRSSIARKFIQAPFLLCFRVTEGDISSDSDIWGTIVSQFPTHQIDIGGEPVFCHMAWRVQSLRPRLKKSWNKFPSP